MAATLLLADDSVTIQRVVELTFDGEDVRVIAVGDGDQAIRRIDAEAPDIVLADVGMPKVDGYGVAAHIKQSPALRHIPVLLLTGAFDPIDEAKAAACRCDGVMVKPFEPQALVSRVSELLANRPLKSGAAAATVVSAPTMAPRAPGPVRVPPPPVSPEPVSLEIDEHMTEFARDLDDLRRLPTSAPATKQSWDVVVRPNAPASSPDFGLGDALDLNRTRSDRQPSAAAKPRPPATPSSTQQAPPEWEAEFLLGPVAPVSGPAKGAPDFGDWDLPARPAPIEHHDDRGPDPSLSAFERTSSREPLQTTPIVPVPAASAPSPIAPVVPAASIAPPPVSPAPSAARSDVPISRAFAALLASEQQESVYRPVVNAPVVSDTMIDDIVRRVVARLTDDSVRRVVLDTAERLVREEIDKIKANPE